MTTFALATLAAGSIFIGAGPRRQGTDPHISFLINIGLETESVEFRDERPVNSGERNIAFGKGASVDYRLSDGRVLRYHSDAYLARSSALARNVELTLITEQQVRVKAQRLLVDIGLDREFEIEEIRLEPETVDADNPRRMKSYGTAHVQVRKKGDRPKFKCRNRWTVAYDRWDGAILYYGLVDSLRFIEEPDWVIVRAFNGEVMHDARY